jgi:hypothetical protein
MRRTSLREVGCDEEVDGRANAREGNHEAKRKRHLFA